MNPGNPERHFNSIERSYKRSTEVDLDILEKDGEGEGNLIARENTKIYVLLCSSRL